MPPIARRRTSRRRNSTPRQDRSSSPDSDCGSPDFVNQLNNHSTKSRVLPLSRDSQENEEPLQMSSTRERQRRRRSSRGNSCITELAKEIVNKKRVVFITGAGLSVASGIRPFRGKSNHQSEALWTQHIWTTATVSFHYPMGTKFWIVSY